MFRVYLFCRILNYIILLGKYCFQIKHMHTFVKYFASLFSDTHLLHHLKYDVSGLAAPIVFHIFQYHYSSFANFILLL